MTLNEPKAITFWIAVALAVIALIAAIIVIPVLSDLAFWILLVGFILLALGNLLKGL